MTSAGGQQLAIDTLLPAGATMQMVDPAQENIGETGAANDPMTQRLYVEAPSAASVRFLHLVQGADGSAELATGTAFRSNDGGFDGALITTAGSGCGALPA